MCEGRDAIQLAIDIAEAEVPEEAIPSVGASYAAAAPLESLIANYALLDNEDDLIAEDLRRFDPDSRLIMRSASAARFVGNETTLTILNVNRKPIEHVLGVDLVYWDELHETFTLVQYKRLTKHSVTEGGRKESDWAYTHQADLEKQLQLMSLPSDNRSAANWRLSPSPFWFKFVHAEEFRASEQTVLRGMYVPAEFLRLAISDNALTTGPRGGFEVTYRNTRYITRDVFVELVRRGLIGTTQAATHHVHELVRQLSTDREVVLALRTKNVASPTSASTRWRFR
ncbi:MAG: hypothetical protein ACYDEY_04315 [Acidimicrobiales bacterium]